MKSLLQNIKSSLAKDGQNWLILLILSMFWGSSFILIKKALIVFSPHEVGILRISISGLAFVPFVLWRWKYLRRKDLGFFILVGMTGTTIPSFMYPLAQTQISSSISGVINSLTPLFTLLIGLMMFSRPFEKRQMLGVVIGFGAILLLILQDASSGGSQNAAYAIFAVIASICYGLSGNITYSKLSGVAPLDISAASFVLVGIPIVIWGLISGLGHKVVQVENAHALLLVFILALGSTVFASVIFFRLIHNTGAVFASSVSYLIPIVAMGWGFFDGESISVYFVLSLALILLGLYLIRKS